MSRKSAEKNKDENNVPENKEYKRRKVETEPYKILGGEWKGMELEAPIDWQARRREILERLENEEK